MGGTKLSSTLPNFTGRVLDHGRYHIIRFLGSGAYGAVYRAVDLKASATNDPSPHRAIKILRKTRLTKSQAQAVQREVRLHYSMAAHPNVVTMHRVFEDHEHVYIVLEYCHGGTLFNKICRDGVYWKNDELLRKVFLQIVDAVFACHRSHVFHRDLKPENILISEDGSTPYLADFGLATDERFSTTFGCGSSLFMSPECIAKDRGILKESRFGGEAYSTSHSDLWSLGIILINMITARSPWSKALLTNHNYSNFVLRPAMLREMLPISEGAASIIISLLNPSPHERITLSSLREAIIELDTFFMCDEEIALSGETVRAVAGTFEHKVRRLANEDSKPDVSPCMVRTKFRNKRMGSKGKFGECVYTPPPVQETPDVKVAEVKETKAPSGSSTDESEGPVTPETHPVDAAVVVSSLEGGLDGGAKVVQSPQKAGPLGVLSAIISSLVV